MMHKDLQIEIVENGFIIHERDIGSASMSKAWVFACSESLSDFILNWGNSVMEEKRNDSQKLTTNSIKG